MNSRIYSQPLIIYIHHSGKKDASFFSSSSLSRVVFQSVRHRCWFISIKSSLTEFLSLPYASFQLYNTNKKSYMQVHTVRRYKNMQWTQKLRLLFFVHWFMQYCFPISCLYIYIICLYFPNKSYRVELGYPICGKFGFVGIVRFTLFPHPIS